MTERHAHAATLISTLHTQPHERALIEITGLMPKSKPVKHYWTNVEFAAQDALAMNENGYSSFVNVNPRLRFSGFETDVAYVHALPLDLQPERTSIADVYKVLATWNIPPSIVAVSGFGYHFYLLVEPADPLRAKPVSERLCKWTLSDPIHSTNRIMRCTGTWNLKKSPPMPCYLVECHPTRRYTIDFVEAQMALAGAPKPAKPLDGTPIQQLDTGTWNELRDQIRAQPGGEGILHIIDTGEPNAYSEKQITRSEADWAVVCALVRANASDERIYAVYASNPVGDMKFASAGMHYLNKTIEAARRATAEKPAMNLGGHAQQHRPSSRAHSTGKRRFDTSR